MGVKGAILAKGGVPIGHKSIYLTIFVTGIPKLLKYASDSELFCPDTTSFCKPSIGQPSIRQPPKIGVI